MKPRPKIKHIGIVAAMNEPSLFQPFFAGESWDHWRTVLKGAFALPMSSDEREFFRTIAERDPPTSRVRELWIIAGRRAGKDSIASMISAHAAALFNQGDRLRRGERALVACLGCNREQAQIVLNYTRSYFADIPALKAMVTKRVATGFALNNGVDIAIATNSFRSIRGRSILCTIFDEVAYWRDENSATPDEEVYQAVKPGMATLPGAMLIGISSPYRKAGLLFKKFRAHYGNAGDDILVIKAPSILLNPTLDQAIIDQAFAEDPALAAAEWMAEFRTDIEGFVSYEIVRSCVGGHYELAPLQQHIYHAFVDPSGGSADSFTLAIAHKEADRIVVDAVHERKPPFNPETVVDDFAIALKPYRVFMVTGDRYGGEWPREQFRKRGINYVCAQNVRSDLYRNLLPLLNSGRVVLPKSDQLVNQIVGLERRVARSGKDSIDHAPGGHDDLANSVAGVCDLITLAERYPQEQASSMPYSGVWYSSDNDPPKSETRLRLEAEMANGVPPCLIDFNKPENQFVGRWRAPGFEDEDELERE